mgnify:CR=1 FL=1
MSGELNGVKALLLIGDGAGTYSEIIGQVELSDTFNGTPIDISEKSVGDFVTYLNNELATNGLSISGGMVYNNHASFELFRSKQVSRLITDFKLSFNAEDTTSLYVSGVITEISDNLALGDKVITNFNIQSTGESFRSQLFVPVGSDKFVTSDGKDYRVRI